MADTPDNRKGKVSLSDIYAQDNQTKEIQGTSGIEVPSSDFETNIQTPHHTTDPDLSPQLSKNKSGIVTIGDKLDHAWNSNKVLSQGMDTNQRKFENQIRQGMVRPFNATIHGEKYERYYNHPNFKKLGFTPFRDNEKLYNEYSSGWDDFRRAASEFGTLARIGFMDALTWGDTSDRKAAAEFEKAMAIGQSTRGGFSGFANNLFLNSGYTFGIIGEMIAEEAVLALVTALTGGATSGVLGASIANKMRQLGKAGDVIQLGATASKTLNTVDNLGDISKARMFWERTKGVGKWLGTKVAPDTALMIKEWDKVKDLGNLAKTTTAFGSFYKDVRTIRLAYGESSLEAGMMENERLEDLYAEKFAEVGRPLTDQEITDIKTEAAEASWNTFRWNLPVIWASNQIVLDNLFHAFSPTRNILKQPIVKNIAGELVQDYASKTVPTQIIERNAKNFFKGFLKPRTYGRAGLNYLRANLAEGLQETAQETISGWSREYYKLDPNDRTWQAYGAMAWESMASQASAQGLETFLSGFLMGGPVNVVTGGVTRAIDKIKQFRDPQYAENRTKAMESLQKAQELVNKFILDPKSIPSTDISKMYNLSEQTKISDGLNEANRESDKKSHRDGVFTAEMADLLRVLDAGLENHIIDRYEHLMKITDPAEIKEMFPNIDDPEKVPQMLQEKIDTIKRVKKERAQLHRQMPNPNNPNNYKKGTAEYQKAVNQHKAWNDMLNFILFNKEAFQDNLKRKKGIIDQASKDINLGTANGSDFNSLFDFEQLNTLISTKLDNLYAYLGVPLTGAEDVSITEEGLETTPTRATTMRKIKTVLEADEAAQLKGLPEESVKKYREEKAYFEKLLVFQEAMEKTQGISNERNAEGELVQQAEWEQASSDARQAFAEVLEVMTDEMPFDTTVDQVFQGLLDYYGLDVESVGIQRFVNTALDPQFMLRASLEAAQIREDAQAQKMPYLKEALDKFINSEVAKQLTQELFNADKEGASQGMFLDPDSFQALIENGTFPNVLFYANSPHEQVLKGSKDWNVARKIIADYIKNVKGIPIPEAVMDPGFQGFERSKFENDNREIADLAEQFGFNPDQETTEVKLALVLERVANSEFATESEKELARMYLETVEDDAVVEFRMNHEKPGTYYSATPDRFVIDPRYHAVDYKNGGNIIEITILHEETHRRTVAELRNEGSEFGQRISKLMEIVDNSDQLKAWMKENPDLMPYGLKNEAEFVAAAMTSPAFQSLLSQIEAPGFETKNKLESESVWSKFISSVLDFLEKTFTGRPRLPLPVTAVPNSVLNAAIDVITTELDIAYPIKMESQKQRVDRSFNELDATLKTKLKDEFGKVNQERVDRGENPILENWESYSEKSLFSTEAFKDWYGSKRAQDLVAEHYGETVEAMPDVETLESDLYYTGPNPTATVVVLREVDGQTQVLLVKRAKDAVEGGKWALPGGFIDTDAKPGFRWTEGKETTREAGVRELKEETGIDLSGLDPNDYSLGSLGVRDDRGADPRNSKTSWVEDRRVGMMIPEGVDSEPMAADDAAEARWFTAEEINEMGDAEFAFDHANVLVQQTMRKPAAAPELKVGQTVKVNTKKDGTGVIAEDRGSKVLLEDGRQVAKKNLTLVDEGGEQLELFEGKEKKPAAGDMPDKEALEAEKAEKLKPLLEERERIQKRLDELRSLIRPKSQSGNKYYDYPELPYERGLNNILAALAKIDEYASYDVDQVEQLLNDLGASDFIKEEFAKIKEVLRNSGVTMQTTLGEGVSPTSYAEFRADNNDIILNLGLILADPKVETANDIAQIIGHEMVHAATVYKTAAAEMTDVAEAAPLTEREQAAVRDINAVLDEIRTRPEFADEYAITNVNELLAELMNESFVTKLKNTTLKGQKSLWETLVDAITRLLGGVEVGENAYNKLYSAYEILLEQDATPQREAMIEKFANNPIYVRGRAIPKDTAIQDRKIEYDLLKEQSETEDLSQAVSQQSDRLRRLEDRDLYDRYKTDAGGLNIAEIKREINALEIELASIDAQIEAIENDYAEATGERRTTFLEGTRQKLFDLGYTRSDVLKMNQREAARIIQDGITKQQAAEEVATKKQAEKEAELQEIAKERAAIRDKMDKMLENVETYEEFQQLDKFAKDLLRDYDQMKISGYTPQEVKDLLENKKKELAQKVSFDGLKVNSVVMLGDNVNKDKFIVIKKTKNQVKIRRFGDPAAKVLTVNRSNAASKIKYMYNEFLPEIEEQMVEPTEEQKSMMKEDMETIQDLGDPETVKEDIENARNKSDEEVEGDWENAIENNC